MKRFLAALFLLAAPAILGAPFALTNTRYGGVVPRDSMLTTNGREAFVLWDRQSTIYLTRVVDGEYRVGRQVLSGASHPDIVWTGTHFLAVADTGSNIVGRVIDAQGEPVGGVFTIVENGTAPRVAWNGRNALLVFTREGSVMATLLTATGIPVDDRSVTVATGAAYDVASNGSGFAVITAAPSLVQVTTITAGGSIAEEATLSTFDLEEPVARSAVGIASDGTGYLGVWSTRALFDAVPVAADGTLGTPFQLGRLEEGESVHYAAVAWTDGGYAASFVGGPRHEMVRDNRLYVARATTHALHSLSDGVEATGGVSLAAIGGRTLLTWHDGSTGSLLLGETSDLNRSVPVTFGAASQALGAAVSSKTATLFAWNEFIDNTGSLRVGVRGADGSWAERRIGTGDDVAYAAGTDGTEFLLIAVDLVGWSAVRIDAQANVLSRSPRIPLENGGDFTIVSNGKDYAVSYTTDHGKPALVRVSRTGVVSPPQIFPVRDSAYRTSVATDGDHFLFVWNDVKHCFFPFCGDVVRVIAVRLGPDFTPIDTHVLAESDDEFMFGSAWRKGTYQVFWTTEDGVVIQNVPASGPVDSARRTRIPETEDLFQRWERLQVTVHGNRWLAIWPRSGGSGETTRYFDFRWRTIPTSFAHDRNLIAMPDGRLAWAGDEMHEAAPHHGTVRLTLDVPESPAAVPHAPRATLRYDGRVMTIEWTPPAQAVDGYRVEYRIGNGSWNEFPRQYGVNERSATWTSIARGKSYAFRVRAFTEAGTGAYSEPVRATAGAPKRRSVR